MTVSVILSLPTWTTNGAHVILKTKHQSHETDPIEDPGKRIGETERERTEREKSFVFSSKSLYKDINRPIQPEERVICECKIVSKLEKFVYIVEKVVFRDCEVHGRIPERRIPNSGTVTSHCANRRMKQWQNEA